jgi:hypothetical protein
MSVIHLHRDEVKDFGSVVVRVFSWLRAMHRLGCSDEHPSDRDPRRYPRAPLVLSDKWDF